MTQPKSFQQELHEAINGSNAADQMATAFEFEALLAVVRQKHNIEPSHDLKGKAFALIDKWEKLSNELKNRKADPARIAQIDDDVKTLKRMYGVILGSFIEDSLVTNYKVERDMYKAMAQTYLEQLNEFKTFLKVKSLSPDKFKLFELWTEGLSAGISQDEMMKRFFKEDKTFE